MKEKLTIALLEEKFGICRLANTETIPNWATAGGFFSITKTDDELSIVCAEKYIDKETICEKDWRVLKVLGPLDFELVGILARISKILAEQSISIFAISTYDTDYILVKEKDIDEAISCLRSGNYIIKTI